MIDNMIEKINNKSSINFSEPSFYAEKLNWLGRYKRRLTYKDLFKKIKTYHRGKVKCVLDVGCGSGFLLGEIQKRHPSAQLVGVEFDHRLNASIHANCSNCIILNEHAENFRTNLRFDLIISTQVIEHLYSPHEMIKLVADHLTDTGIAVFTTPNPNGVGAKVHGKNWNGIRDDHVSLKSASEWEEIFSKKRTKHIV